MPLEREKQNHASKSRLKKTRHSARSFAMFEDPFTDNLDNLSNQDAIQKGYKYFLTATITFGDLLDPNGEPTSYDFAECFREINEDTLRDFYKRVADDACDLLEEE